MKKTVIVALFSLTIVSIFSFCKRPENHDIVLTSEINMEHQILNFESTKKEGNSHSGKYYSSVDSVSKYGVGYSFVIADSLKEKNLTIYVSGWVREEFSPIDGTIAVAISTSKWVAKWQEFVSKDNAYKPGQWTEINDSLTVQSSLLKDEFVEVSVFGFKQKGSDKFDTDDIRIKYKFSK